MRIKLLLTKVVGIAGCVAFMTTAPLNAEEVMESTQGGEEVVVEIDEGGALFDSVGMTLSLGYDSNYLFRGVNFGDNLVWAGLDLGIPITEGVSLGLGMWYGDVIENDAGVDNELDLYANLGFSVGPVDLGVGFTHYRLLSQGSYTSEVGATMGGKAGPINVGLGYYYDWEEYEGHYLEATVSSSFKVTPWLAIEPAAGIAYGFDYNFGGNGWDHVVMSLGFPIALTETATLTPYIAGNLPIDKLEDTGEDALLYGGVSLSVEF